MQNQFTFLIPYLGFGTLVFNIATVLGFLLFLLSKNSSKKSILSKASNFLSENAISLGLIIATIATLSSLFLSEIVLFTPCKLCWYQRIAMYPQVVILGIAFLKNDTKAKLYAFVLSIIGFLIALYHIALQFYPAIFPCSDEVANCALKQFEYFGYITIPVMSASAFLSIIVIMLFGLRKSAR